MTKQKIDRNASEKLQKSLELLKEANKMIAKLREEKEHYKSLSYGAADVAIEKETELKKLKSHWTYKLRNWLKW